MVGRFWIHVVTLAESCLGWIIRKPPIPRPPSYSPQNRSTDYPTNQSSDLSTNSRTNWPQYYDSCDCAEYTYTKNARRVNKLLLILDIYTITIWIYWHFKHPFLSFRLRILFY
jgi:hypothetical protein